MAPKGEPLCERASLYVIGVVHMACGCQRQSFAPPHAGRCRCISALSSGLSDPLWRIPSSKITKFEFALVL